MVRKATVNDIDQIAEIYNAARVFMRQTGNPTQWSGGYPQRELTVEDIKEGKLYVVELEDRLCGVFYFNIGIDPTYLKIDGAWGSDAPYGVIHRIASDGSERGVFSEALNFCKEQISHIRIDTHEDNKVMQSVLSKHGFKLCGTIYLANGDPRRAYELISN